MHQFPAGHIRECLDCCEGLTVQLDPWALNYSRQKQEEKRIIRKLCEGTQKFFHSLEAFSRWPYLWKGNEVSMARDAEMPHSPSWIQRHDLCRSDLPFPAPFLFSMHTGLSTPLYIVLARVGQAWFLWDRGVRWGCFKQGNWHLCKWRYSQGWTVCWLSAPWGWQDLKRNSSSRWLLSGVRGTENSNTSSPIQCREKLRCPRDLEAGSAPEGRLCL